ncbi:MAG: cytidylyltransferase domain-containing protein, partial [Gammaproteobacteria bacterium]
IKDVFNPNLVKVVANDKQQALYFSRAPIPWQRGVFSHDVSQMPDQMVLAPSYFRHIGLYAYRAGFVKDYVQWPVDPVEQIEQLEQLRVLMRGYQIAIAPACATSPIGVDTAEDLAIARQLVAQY